MSDWLSDYLDWKADHPELDEVQRATSTVEDGLDALFHRLGLSTDRATEK
jgi:hypothetical protein